MRATVTVNGREHEIEDIRPHESLLYLLRERLGLTGSKNACEQGECGSCTVRLDEETVCACLVPAAQAHGRTVRTVEALCEPSGKPCPLQESFVAAGAIQCGFCTPGLLVSLERLLETEPDPSEADIREELSGHLCRCTGYQKVVEAARLAAARGRQR